MQKIEKNNSHNGKIQLPQYKTDFAYQKEHQKRIFKEQKGSSNKKIDISSLLMANKARESLKDLDGWQMTDDHKMIYREFKLQDFLAAIDLIDRIALIAEDEKHHPDIHLTQYRNLRVVLTSHDVGGLTMKDFTVALKIDNGAVKEKPMPRSRLAPNKKENKTKRIKFIS